MEECFLFISRFKMAAVLEGFVQLLSNAFPDFHAILNQLILVQRWSDVCARIFIIPLLCCTVHCKLGHTVRFTDEVSVVSNNGIENLILYTISLGYNLHYVRKTEG